MYIRLVVFVIISLIGGNSNAIAQNENCNSKIDYKIFTSVNNTWGYDIFIDNKLKIHQATIPCLNGIEGFKSKNSAAKTAKLVIQKMKEGKMPPTITIEELKTLKAL